MRAVYQASPLRQASTPCQRRADFSRWRFGLVSEPGPRVRAADEECPFKFGPAAHAANPPARLAVGLGLESAPAGSHRSRHAPRDESISRKRDDYGRRLAGPLQPAPRNGSCSGEQPACHTRSIQLGPPLPRHAARLGCVTSSISSFSASRPPCKADAKS